jgi:hypothetical protein
MGESDSLLDRRPLGTVPLPTLPLPPLCNPMDDAPALEHHLSAGDRRDAAK